MGRNALILADEGVGGHVDAVTQVTVLARIEFKLLQMFRDGGA